MSTITRERIEQLANGNNICKVTREERIELARIALASLEAEPYGYTDGDKHGMLYEPRHVERLSNPRALFTAPPSPVSVPDEYVAAVPTPTNLGYEAGWNACRAAMLDQEKSNG